MGDLRIVSVINTRSGEIHRFVVIAEITNQLLAVKSNSGIVYISSTKNIIEDEIISEETIKNSIEFLIFDSLERGKRWDNLNLQDCQRSE